MTIETFEQAILMKIVEGDVVEDKKPTLEDIGEWTEVEKAHAVANTLVSLEYERQSEMKGEMLARLIELGWDGITEEDFLKDYKKVSESLRGILSPPDWDGYFATQT